tara:strand:- start:162 stop:428 length:267 start_codon:yes stop_codon:yes gene_type:complete
MEPIQYQSSANPDAQVAGLRFHFAWWWAPPAGGPGPPRGSSRRHRTKPRAWEEKMSKTKTMVPIPKKPTPQRGEVGIVSDLAAVLTTV